MKPLFWVRHHVEKYRKKKKKLYMMFIDLEKAYDQVLREVLKRTLMRIGVTNTYIIMKEDMFDGPCTRIKIMYGETENFMVELEVHQGSALCYYLFSIAMN